MELSVREAKARLAATAAANGERVIVTRHGRPFVELIPAQPATGMDFIKAELVRRELGLDGVEINLPDNFDDAAFSCEVLGLPA